MKIEFKKLNKIPRVIALLLLTFVLVLSIYERFYFEKRALVNFKVGDKVTYGRYVTDEEFDEYETPIEWIVADKKDDEYFLVSSYILETKKYNEIYESCDWTNCSLRKWLNEDFYINSFNDEEKKFMVVQKTNIKKYATTSEINNERLITTEKVSLLSSEDVTTFLKPLSLENTSSTMHARKEGLLIFNMFDFSSFYWLKENGYDDKMALYETPYGDRYISSFGLAVDTDYIGVRPTIRVKNNKGLKSINAKR